MKLYRKLGLSKPMRSRLSLRRIVLRLTYRPSLHKLDLTPLNTYPVTAFAVFRCARNGTEVIAKMAVGRNEKLSSALKREQELTRRLNGMDGVPGFVCYEEGVEASGFSTLTNLLRFGVLRRDTINVLVRTYVAGTVLSRGDRLDPGQRKRLTDIVAACHHEGFAGLELGGPWNFILDDKADVHFVDLGSKATRASAPDGAFDELVGRDLEKLERWFV